MRSPSTGRPRPEMVEPSSINPETSNPGPKNSNSSTRSVRQQEADPSCVARVGRRLNSLC